MPSDGGSTPPTSTTLHGPGIGDNCLGVAAVLVATLIIHMWRIGRRMKARRRTREAGHGEDECGACFRHIGPAVENYYCTGLTENEFVSDELPVGVDAITLAETWAWRDEIAHKEGLLLGPKGAACVKMAVEFQDRVASDDQAIVALNPDAGYRYLGWEDKTLFRT